MNRPDFNYDPQKLKRELTPFYISASKQDIDEMLKAIGLEKLEDLFQELPDDIKLEELKLEAPMEYEKLANHLFELSLKNKPKTSFIGDSVQDYKQPEVLDRILEIRNLTTAYTPYQPERSQGTLATLWNYSNALAKITHFHAIITSLYERST